MSRSHFFSVALFLAVMVAYCSAIPVDVEEPAVSSVVVAADNAAVGNARPKRQFLAGLLIGKALGAGYGYGVGRSAYYGGYGHYHGGYRGPYGYRGYGYGGHYW